jgi:hypothetical protein
MKGCLKTHLTATSCDLERLKGRRIALKLPSGMSNARHLVIGLPRLSLGYTVGLNRFKDQNVRKMDAYQKQPKAGADKVL